MIDGALSVSEVSARLKGAVEGAIGQVWIKGELAELKVYASGHWYFTGLSPHSDAVAGPGSIAPMLRRHFPDEVIDIVEFRDQVSVIVRKDRIEDILRMLRDTPGLDFDFLADLCGVDYLNQKTHRFEVVYHLYSVTYCHMIRVKAQVLEEDPSIRSVTGLWAGANWFERECYDLFGIRFDGHPDLRRVLMPDDWEGHPLRKDYPLESELGEAEWQGYRDVLDTAESNKRFDVT